MKILFKIVFMILAAGLGSVGCGVKGDPKAPLIPAELGHGRPSFRRTVKTEVPPQIPDSEPTPSNDQQSTEPSEQE